MSTDWAKTWGSLPILRAAFARVAKVYARVHAFVHPSGGKNHRSLRPKKGGRAAGRAGVKTTGQKDWAVPGVAVSAFKKCLPIIGSCWGVARPGPCQLWVVSGSCWPCQRYIVLVR